MIKQKQAQAEKNKPMLENREIWGYGQKKIPILRQEKASQCLELRNICSVNVKDEVVTIVSNTDGKQLRINRCNLQKVGSEMEEIPKN